MTNLEKAVENLSATKLENGDYAYYDDGMRRYYVVDSSDLEGLVDYLESDDADIRDAYSHWCAGTTAQEMPEGWSPEN